MKLPSWVWGGLSTVALLFGIRGAAGPPSAPAPSPSPIPSVSAKPVAVEGTAVLAIDRRGDATTLGATLFLRNELPCPQTALLSLSLIGADGRGLTPQLWVADSQDQRPAHPLSTAMRSVPPFSSTPVALRIASADKDADLRGARGHLGIRSWVDGPPTDASTALRAACTEAANDRDGLSGGVTFREITLLSPRPSTIEGRVIWGSAVAAVAIAVLGVVLGTWKKKPADHWIGKRMGSVAWEESWCSNVAVGAGLLTLLLDATVLPGQTRLLPHGSYVLLSALFAALVALAPAIYGGFRSPKVIGADGTEEMQEQGFAGIFVLASVLTLWGAAGQIATALFALRELEVAWVLAASAVTVLEVLVGAVGVLIAAYAVFALHRFVVEISAVTVAGSASRQASSERLRVAYPAQRAADWRLL
jgi:hypothetical protein